MHILDRYVGLAVIGSTLMVMSVLLGLFSFVQFVVELEVVGKGDYGVWQALQYVILSMPRLAYQMMPLAALLGSLIGLGLLASNNELVIMRASGVSVRRITWAAIKAGLVMMLVAILLSEFVIADAEQRAQEIRSGSLAESGSLRTAEGFWTRSGNDFINVRAVLPGGKLLGINIYQLGDQRQLHLIATARAATYDSGRWKLEKVAQSTIGENGVGTSHLDHMNWASRLSPGLLDILAVKPESLSAWGLYKYILYLTENDLDSARYEMELWTKIVLPFATVVMVYLAVPFVFGPLRSGGIGQRVLVGALVGIGFYVVTRIFNYVGLVYDFEPVLGTLLPTVMFLVIAHWMMRRVQ